MQYIHLALALHSAGKEITVENIKKMATAAGIKPDDGQIKALVAVLEDTDIDDAIKSAPVGMVAAPAGAASPAEAETKAKEEIKKNS